MPDPIKREHFYHAEATALSGHFDLPVNQQVESRIYTKLPETGGYLAQRSDAFRVESVLYYRSAYTQVAGNKDVKAGHGWTSLATAVVEGLNVLDIVTADRVVGQVSVEHPLVGYVPRVTFLGTRFDNLRIAGHPVKLDLHPDLFGSSPASDGAYTRDQGFLGRVASQFEHLHRQPDLPAEVHGRYNRLPATSGEGALKQEKVECSLINQADGAYPGRSFGHVIKVPDFGTIYLATVSVEHSDFQDQTGVPKETLIHLNMLELEMGCLASGSVKVSAMIVNGRSKP